MALTRITFEQVKLKAKKTWIDETGKKRQRTATFMKTINPWNKNADGSMKTREQVMADVCAERDAWLNGGAE